MVSAGLGWAGVAQPHVSLGQACGGAANKSDHVPDERDTWCAEHWCPNPLIPAFRACRMFGTPRSSPVTVPRHSTQDLGAQMRLLRDPCSAHLCGELGSSTRTSHGVLIACVECSCRRVSMQTSEKKQSGQQ